MATTGRALADTAACRYAAQLARYAADAQRLGVAPSRLETHVLRADVCGLAGPLAVDYAHAANCDVAVLGSRGLGAFKRCADAQILRFRLRFVMLTRQRRR